MDEAHKVKVKAFGDDMAKDRAVLAHVITVWYRNGDVENNWSGLEGVKHSPFLLLDNGDVDDENE